MLVRSYNKDDFCKLCRHLKETVRIRLDMRTASCLCKGECGCFVCIKCTQVPCRCQNDRVISN